METAFGFNKRVYEWNGMVLGFKNSPQILQRIMDKFFEEYRGNGIKVYMNDIVIHVKPKESMMSF